MFSSSLNDPSTFLIETLSPPGLLAPALAALPSMSLIPFAPFLVLTFPRALLIRPTASTFLIETRSPPGLPRSYPRRFTLITRTASCSRQLP